MKMWCPSKRKFFVTLTFLVLATIVNSTGVHQDAPTSHEESLVPSSTSSLEAEARGDSDGLDVNAIEEKSKNTASILAIDDKKDKQPIILGTSKVAIVYSERKASVPEKEKNIKAPRVVYPQTQASTISKPSPSDRNWRGVRVSPKDSYLDAFEHSQSSKDPREGVIGADVKPKIAKLIRRDYTEGPVYRHPHEQYGGTKETVSSYSLPQEVKNRLMTTKNINRISYGGPTPEPFFPTPSDSYSLPIQSNINFNNNNNNNNNNDDHDFYGSPQISYGSPAPQSQIYGLPNNNYNKGPSAPQSSYGPPNHGYPPAGIPQQAYGPPPSLTYGAPYANHGYAHQISSLMPSIDFSWPFALKLNAFTLAKILLKLVIFKMIVKFIALICLLLFIPKLEIIKKVESNDDSDDSDDSRRLFSKNSNLERLNILTAFVTSAIEKYNDDNEISGKSADDCTSFVCRARKFFTHKETWSDYVRLFKSYVTAETETDDDDQGARTNRVDS